LLRNDAWQKNANVKNGYVGWTIVADDLPPGVEDVFVSGGHAPAPTGTRYYLRVREPDPKNSGQTILALYRHSDGVKGWNRLFGGLVDIIDPVTTNDLPDAFVNPYDIDEAWVEASDGIHVSTDGGVTFPLDPVLTALVTDSGRYQMTRNSADDNSYAATALAAGGRTRSLLPIADVAWSRNNPKVRVFAATLTGVFYDDGDGIWRSLTPALPKPLSLVSGVKSDGKSIFVSLGGRSVVRVDLPGAGRPVTFYTTNQTLVNGIAGNLIGHDQHPIGGATIVLHAQNKSGVPLFDGSVTTGSGGEIPISILPKQLVGGAVFIRFPGDKDNAPSETRFAVIAACVGRFCST
jgi:hypothetical protein